MSGDNCRHDRWVDEDGESDGMGAGELDAGSEQGWDIHVLKAASLLLHHLRPLNFD